MSQIKVVSNAAGREISIDEPVVLGLTTIEDLVESLGEDLAVNMIKNQLKVSFRAVIRRKLEEKDDNEEFANSDEAILADDYSDWKPTLRVTKSAEEKAMEALGNLPPDVREAVLANFANSENDAEEIEE
jgi:DNA-directed RNA polymerase specialized sigma24 family protein